MIKFIDHDDSSRITMDYVKGELLVNKVKATSDLTKDMVFSWFYNLLTQMIQYHKCYHNRNYRYLNPFSVVITQDNEVYLLDIDEPSNHFVLKHLQTPSMREHFLKTTIQPTKENKARYDIYCFGKTLQYTLACLEPYIALSKMEELKLFKLVEKCFEENVKKSYDNFFQVKKDLNFTKVKKRNQAVGFNKKKLKIILSIVLVLMVVNIVLGAILDAIFSEENSGGAFDASSSGVATGENHEVGEDGQGLLAGEDGVVGHEGETSDPLVEDDNATGGSEGYQGEQGNSSEARVEENERGTESLDDFLRNLDEDIDRLLEYLHHNDKESNQKIISYGEEMELTILRGLAMAYDREGYHEQAILAYGRLIGIENREELLERAILRKMRLEEELGLLEQALETGRNGLDMNGGSIEIGRLYLEILINGNRATIEEIRIEYDRLKEFIPELEEDEIRERIENLE